MKAILCHKKRGIAPPYYKNFLVLLLAVFIMLFNKTFESHGH